MNVDRLLLLCLTLYLLFLCIPVPGLKGRYRAQTPAMAAGLTDRMWTVGELLRTPIILPET